MKPISFLMVLALSLAGCGDGPSEKIQGRVTLNGDPLPNAAMQFIPIGETGGTGASGMTDKDGNYLLTPHHQAAELAVGEYKVVISRRLNPDGSEPDPNTPPIESQAVETLPPHYSDRERTKLRVKIAKDKKQHDFQLEAPKPPKKK